MKIKMDDNTFLIIFCILVLTFIGINDYFKEQTKQMKIEANYKIAKMQTESNNLLSNSMFKITSASKN